MTVLDVVLSALVMAAGAAVQGAVGFGANLVAAPILVLIDERFVPAPMVLTSAVLNLLVLRREGRTRVDPTVNTAIAGQVVGVIGAGFLLAAVSDEALSLLFAVLVLFAVALSALGWHLAKTRPNLAGVGVLSGFMGTVSGIGGPPVALAYQQSDGPSLRGTLARYFFVGNLVGIPTLIVAGRLGREELLLSAAIIPGILLGYAASGWLAGHLDKRAVRPYILTLSAAAAVVVLIRTIV